LLKSADRTIAMNESGLRVLLCPFGTLGEIQPTIALGATLRQRGHEVRILAPAIYQRNAQALGLEFVAVGSPESFEAFMAQRLLWHPTLGYALLARGVADMIEPGYAAVLAHQAKGRTVLVHSWMSVGARIARDVLNIPAVTLHPYPMIFRSRFDPPEIPPLPLRKGAPAWNGMWYGAIDLLMDHLLARPVNAFRARLSLPPVRRIMQDWIHSPDCAIGLFPDWFAPPQPDWPAQARLTGFPLYDAGREEPLSAGLLQFLDDGPPPIVFTSGGAIRHPGAFFRTAVEICEASKQRGVLLAPFGTQLPDLPPSIHSAAYVPFSRLLPRSAALVHHGGIGTIAKALAAGTPQVAVPVVFDHVDNSARMEQLGVGRVIAPRRFDVRTGIAAIERVTSSAHEDACNQVKALFARDVDPLARSAELIEQAFRSAR
jgi:UDP:flavonoid glycosyltransferase YjiC (YdhE family)